MIDRFRHSIQRKLVLLLTVVATFAVVLSCSGLVFHQWQQQADALQLDGYTQANLFSANSAAALLFEDNKAAGETLAALHLDSRVQQACLYDRGGRIVARLQSTKRCPSISDAHSAFNARTFYIVKPVVMKDEAVGTLFLDISTGELHRTLQQSLLFAGATAFASIFLALLLSSYMQRWISGPILRLTNVALRVSREGRYDIRAEGNTADEVGLLIRQFNEMLTCIQQRDGDLRESYDVLESKVQERTVDLTTEIMERKLVERDLEKARIVAEESSQAKSRFLANMSHELRTPLNAIIGYSEMLMEDATADQNAEAVADLQKILSSARHLRSIISDVLDLSKIEAGQMTLNLECVSANGLLADVVATAEVLSKNNRNTLIVESLDRDEFVSVDPLRLRQCLLNLVSNACKFTADGTITVRAERKERKRGLDLVWSVQDTGDGITKEDQGKLFQSFSQVDASATRKFGGTGLGLAISQELCRAMGGDITLHSVPKEGSTFSISIPLLPPTTAELAC